MSYNSARIHSAHDEKALELMLPYILGEDDNLGRSVQLFALLTYPEEVKKREIDKTITSDETIIIEPKIHRVGHILFKVPNIGQKILRVVHLRSFSFLLAFWPSAGGKAEQNDFESIITSKMNGLKLLRANKKNITLECVGIGAWMSLKDARSQFEFSNKQ